MMVSPPAGSPVKILVLVEDASPARWVVWLVEALERRSGTQVFVRMVDRGEGDESSALTTLLSLERMLLRRNRGSGADRIGRGELGGQRAEPAGFKPDVVIDLREGGQPAAPSEAICLRTVLSRNAGYFDRAHLARRRCRRRYSLRHSLARSSRRRRRRHRGRRLARDHPYSEGATRGRNRFAAAKRARDCRPPDRE
jgi:hypothetical protein